MLRFELSRVTLMAMACLSVGGAPASAGAAPTLLGSNVTINDVFPTLGNVVASQAVTVGAGVEVACPDSANALCVGSGGRLFPGESIDVDALSILASFTAGFDPGAFNGIEFLGLDFGAGYELTGFTLTSAFTGLEAGDVSFTTDSLRVNLAGTGVRGGSFRIDLQVGPSEVPEPSSFALAALALVGAVRFRRREPR